MKSIGIIGGGIFGCSAAIALSRAGFDVTLIDQESDLIMGASKNNHLRHHYGYHYPRSKKTAIESIESRKSFEREYGECIINNFPAYYAVSRDHSKSTPDQFIKFCEDLNLEYEIVEPPKNIINESVFSLCVKTPEPAYDPDTLKRIVKEKINCLNIDLILGVKVIGGSIKKDERKEIYLKSQNGEFKREFDFIISAIYSNFNKINDWFGFEKKKFRYDLMELVDVKVPLKSKVAAMIIDGDFSTFVPLKEPGVIRLGNSKYVFLKTIISDNLDAESLIKENKLTNKDKIIKDSVKYYPILKEAKYLRSLFIVRVIKEGVEKNDERPSEITSHGKGIYSIFGGKVVTAVNTAERIKELISKELLRDN